MNLSTLRKPSRKVRTRPPQSEHRLDAGRSAKTDPPPHASRLYANLTPAYEMLWPMVACRHIWEAVKQMPFQPGERVLEVGVGTGLSLRAYPTTTKITGVDLSEDMLAKARERIAEKNWTHVDVMPMDAEKLNFEDHSFDVVCSFHVVSVVSDPQRMMNEVARVVRPGGRILIINHFRSPIPWLAKMVDSAGSVTRRLGWRTDLRFEDLIAEMPFRVDQLYKPSPVSLFTVIHATRLD